MRGRGGFAELADVRAGDEGAALARDHDRADLRVFLRGGERVEQALAHAVAERVHRRVVDPNHAHSTLLRKLYRSAAHRRAPVEGARVVPGGFAAAKLSRRQTQSIPFWNCGTSGAHG